jgi:hypothetical protein
LPQSTPWWPNHESNHAQVRKVTSSACIQYIPQVSKQNVNLFSWYWCDAVHYMIFIKCPNRTEKTIKSEPTIKIWWRYDHYWWSNAEFSVFTKHPLVAKPWIKSCPISKQALPAYNTYLKYQRKSSICCQVIGATPLKWPPGRMPKSAI